MYILILSMYVQFKINSTPYIHWNMINEIRNKEWNENQLVKFIDYIILNLT